MHLIFIVFIINLSRPAEEAPYRPYETLSGYTRSCDHEHPYGKVETA